MAVLLYLGDFFRQIALAIVKSYRLGFAALATAPAIVAFAAVPEFLQHVVEVELGMFASREAAHQVATSAVRYGFGAVKLAGLVLTFLFIARFCVLGSVRRALLIAPRVLARVLLGVLLFLVTGAPVELAKPLLSPAGQLAVLIPTSFIQAAFILWTVGELIEDRENSLAQIFTTRFPNALALILLFIAAMLPGQAIHYLNHRLAVGQPPALVWALMLFDAGVVALIGATTGAALATGYLLRFGRAAVPPATPLAA